MKKTKQKLSDLFHYDCSTKKHADLKKGLEEYRFLLLATLLATQSMKNKDLEKFDALVGENACQIRAIKIALIASGDLSPLDDLEQRLLHSLKKVEDLLSPSSINPLMQKGVSLQEIIGQHELDIQVGEDEMFFIQSYILSEMKESFSDGEIIPSLCRIEKSIPGKLRIPDSKVSLSFLGNLASTSKKLLSEASVLFVIKTVSNLHNSSLLKTLSENILYYNARYCIPMFWTYKMLLSLAFAESIPLILHARFLKESGNGFQVVDEICLYFTPCSITKKYIKTTPSDDSLKTPAWVVQGVVYNREQESLSRKEWIQSFEKHLVADMILAGAAHHRQYPNPDHVVQINDAEYEEYKIFAENNGFSLDNPSTFFIQHVYSSLVKEKHPYL